MSKLLLFVIAAAVIYLVMRGMGRRRDDGGRSGSPPAEQMIPCAHCGVNVPRSEALEIRGRFYCTEEHARLSSR